MTDRQKGDYHRTSRHIVWAVAIVTVATIVGGAGTVLIRTFLGTKMPMPKRQAQQISLVKPPPPKVKEQPPEQKPEPVAKKEEVKQVVEEQAPQEMDRPQDSAPPPAGDLGVDADASGGGDAFGLQARKGAAALVGGGGGSGNGSNPYAWYTNRYGGELQRLFNEIIAQTGGIKSASGLRTVIKLEVDDSGAVRGSILDSSGNQRMDEAVLQAISKFSLREPPPPGMPHAMKLGVMSQG